REVAHRDSFASVIGTSSLRSSRHGAGLIGVAKALEDQAVELEVELDVLGLDALPAVEAETAIAPQQHAVDDAAEDFAHGLLEPLGRDRPAFDEQRAEPFAGPRALHLERDVERLLRHESAVHEHLAGAHRRAVGAGEDRPAALDEEIDGLARA